MHYRKSPTSGLIRKSAAGSVYNDDHCCCGQTACPCFHCNPGTIPAFVTVTLENAVPLPPNLIYFLDLDPFSPGFTLARYQKRYVPDYLEVNGIYELPCVGDCQYSDRFLLKTVTEGFQQTEIYLRLTLSRGNLGQWVLEGDPELFSVGTCEGSAPQSIGEPGLRGHLIRAGWPSNTVRDQIESFTCAFGDERRVFSPFKLYGNSWLTGVRTFELPCDESIVGNYTMTRRFGAVIYVPERDAACSEVSSNNNYVISNTCAGGVGDPGDTEPFTPAASLVYRNQSVHAADFTNLTCTVS